MPSIQPDQCSLINSFCVPEVTPTNSSIDQSKNTYSSPMKASSESYTRCENEINLIIRNGKKITPPSDEEPLNLRTSAPLLSENSTKSFPLSQFFSSSVNYPSHHKREKSGQSQSRFPIDSEFIYEECDSTTACHKVLTYAAEGIAGTGSFGAVYKARIIETGEIVAIKRVFLDQRYKNREFAILQRLNHPNVIRLRRAFFTAGDKLGEHNINLVMDYVPATLFHLLRSFHLQSLLIPILHVRYYSYQICRAIAYSHALGICHRDLKPQNLLFDPSTHRIQLCDFGSAKNLKTAELNVSYICSRYYRAPELIFGSSEYTTAVDLWSFGCVLVELLSGSPLFVGETGVEQLVEIIKVLGTPDAAQLKAMNKNYPDFRFPYINPIPWSQVLGGVCCPRAIDLVARLLQFNPNERIRPMDALCHPFYDELRVEDFRLPDLKGLPDNLFNFTREELDICTPGMLSILLPKWIRNLT